MAAQGFVGYFADGPFNELPGEVHWSIDFAKVLIQDFFTVEWTVDKPPMPVSKK